jgi:hypothetical protein
LDVEEDIDEEREEEIPVVKATKRDNRIGSMIVIIFVYVLIAELEEKEVVTRVEKIISPPENPKEEPEPKDLYEAYMYYKKCLDGINFEKQSHAASIFYKFLGEDRDEVTRHPFFVDGDVIKRLVGLIRTVPTEKVRSYLF